MNLYIWEGVLNRYGDGVAFAHAPSIGDARLLVIQDYDPAGDGQLLVGYYLAYLGACDTKGRLFTEDEVWDLRAGQDPPKWVWYWEEFWNEIQKTPREIHARYGRAIPGSD